MSPIAGVVFRQVAGSDGNTIRVAVQGEGPLVLMVHGFPESWFSWRHQMPAIAAAGFTAAAIDVRGYGGSDKPMGIEHYTLKELAGDIVAVIDGLGASSAILVGHDWGAPQVYTTAILFPHRVRALAGLSATAGNFVDRKPSSGWSAVYGDDFFYHRYFWTPGVAEAEIEKDPHRFVRLFYHGLSGDTDGHINPLWQDAGATDLLGKLPEPQAPAPWLSAAEIDYYAQSFIEGGIAAPLNRYRAVDLDVDQLRPFGQQRIEQPAIFIGGARDPARWMIPRTDRYANPVERFSDARGVHILEKAGHWVQQEAAESVNAHLIRFLLGMRQ
jgi:Predicted hydrolases or acyltransferases (alpha/beta hydrolase superfamily)